MTNRLNAYFFLFLAVFFASAESHANSCTNGQLPNIQSSAALANLTVNQVFCDEFEGDQLDNDVWFHEIMHTTEHRVGYERDAEDYEILNGRRWSAFYDNHLEKTAFVMTDENDQGVLVQRGIDDRTIGDPDKDQFYADPDDPDNLINFGRSRLYTSFLKSYVTGSRSSEGHWGPGHYFEIRVNFGSMSMGGHRHSFWLMPATTEELPGLTNICGEERPRAYDCSSENGVEIDIYEYEASPASSRNKLYMKVLGGDAGKTNNSLPFHPNGINYSDSLRTEVEVSSGFEQGQLNRDAWHTIGLYWGSDSLVWYLDGVPVVRDSDRVPTTPHYIILSREMNSGVRENATEGSVQSNFGTIPVDEGLAGENVGLRRNLTELGSIFDDFQFLDLRDQDHVKIDYVRVWQIEGTPRVQSSDLGSTVIEDSNLIVDGNVITLINGSEFVVSTLDSNVPKCENVVGLCQVCDRSDGPCQVSPGTFIVDDISTGQRFDNVVVDEELPVVESVVESSGLFVFPRGHIYQVQSAVDYQTVCEGETRCRVEPGVYNIINLDKGIPNRQNNWNVSGTALSRIFIDDTNVIRWPSLNGWFQVQSLPDYDVVCEGTDSCAVPPGQYVVVNHWTNERFEVNASSETSSSGIEASSRPLQLNDSRTLAGIANLEDYFELRALLRTVSANPNRRDRLLDNLMDAPTIETETALTGQIQGQDFNYTSRRNCTNGGTVYFFQESTQQQTVWWDYYDRCRFQEGYLDGIVSTTSLPESGQRLHDMDIRASISSTQMEIKGLSMLTLSRNGDRRTQITLPLFSVSSPSMAYTSFNASVIAERQLDDTVPLLENTITVSSQVHLTQFGGQAVSYLLRTPEPLSYTLIDQVITGGSIAIDNRNTMVISPIDGVDNEFAVTIQDVNDQPLLQRQVRMDDLSPAS